MENLTLVEGASDACIARWIADALSGALAATEGPVAISVPGGTSPFPIMERLAAMPLEWRRVNVWPGDDRVVPEDHPASNTGRVRALLEPAGARVVPLTLQGQVPRFALAWLGMGEDGHIASLFPSSDPRSDDCAPVRVLAPDPLPPEAPFDRITLTLPALLASDRLLLVIRGAAKRPVLEDAIAGRSDAPVARLLAAARQPVMVFA